LDFVINIFETASKLVQGIGSCGSAKFGLCRIDFINGFSAYFTTAHTRHEKVNFHQCSITANVDLIKFTKIRP